MNPRIKEIIKSAQHYEEQAIRFHAITQLTIEDFLQFYTATGMYPTNEITNAINNFGVDLIIQVIQAGQFEEMKMKNKTLLNDLQKLQSAKVSFVVVLTRIIRNFFGI